jgi:hypothetical protein
MRLIYPLVVTQVMTQHAEEKRNEKVCDKKTQTPNEKKTKHTCEVMMMSGDVSQLISEQPPNAPAYESPAELSAECQNRGPATPQKTDSQLYHLDLSDFRFFFRLSASYILHAVCSNSSLCFPFLG